VTPTTYTDQQVSADLRWVLDSPSLITPDPSWFQPCLPDESWNSHELCEFLQRQHSHRVGYYFENLIQFWLQHSPNTQAVERQIRISNSERTIGELDFAFRDQTGQLHHWEAAVKFYLYSKQPNAAGSHWLGPNAKDYLEKKWKRLREHQLPLAADYFDEPVLSSPIVKGMLFQPFSETAGPIPAFVDADHLQGHWVHYRNLKDIAKRWPASQLIEMEKPFWLAAPLPTFASTSSPFSIEAWNDHFSNTPDLTTRPRLFTVFTAIHSNWEVQIRLFVVPDEWPERSAELKAAPVRPGSV